MAIYLGNIKMKPYLGSTELKEMYMGSTKVYSSRPVVIMNFTMLNGSTLPSSSTLNTLARQAGARWEQTGTNTCKLTVPLYTGAGGQTDNLLGIGRLFSDNNDNSLFTTGSYSMTQISGDWDKIQTIDRTFNGATAISGFAFPGGINQWLASSTRFHASNVNQAFANCTNMGSSEAYNFYTYMKDQASITTHSGTFTGCPNVSNIPTSWGGNWTPTSVAIPTTPTPAKCSWNIPSANFDKAEIAYQGGQIFTTSSISSYAGVSMNRSRCYNRINGFSNASSAAMYFRPCFLQGLTTPGSSSKNQPTWIWTTSGYNGTLSPNQANTDMPGTLDYNTYGALDREYGTYDSTKSVQFAILITNTDSANWAGLTGEMAFLYNSNYKSDAGLYYVQNYAS